MEKQFSKLVAIGAKDSLIKGEFARYECQFRIDRILQESECKHANNEHNKYKCKETGCRKRWKICQTGSHSTTKWATCAKCEDHPGGGPDGFEQRGPDIGTTLWGVETLPQIVNPQLHPLYLTMPLHHSAPYKKSHRHSLLILLHLSYRRRTIRV